MEETSTIGTITNEHAVLLKVIPGCEDLLDYVKAVASVIGGSHIHSVFREGDYIKVYLKEKQYVNAVINSRLLVREQRTKVEFAVPPAAKLVLLHVDPIIPDTFLESWLKSFGPLKSNISHPNVSNDIAYSHIVTGTREVLLDLPNDFVVPKRIELEYKDKTYDLILKVEPQEMSTKQNLDKQFFKEQAPPVLQRNKTVFLKNKNINEDQCDSGVASPVANHANSTVKRKIEVASEEKQSECDGTVKKKRRGGPGRPKKVSAPCTIDGLQSGLEDTPVNIGNLWAREV